ncbi:4'-phosphopantetheinyl transferase superfamily protein [Flavobacterium sp. 7A]|uniref:4'-phosphopantetheinyl transferase family protein n=1 Tax=Flavobacterium sp. 7A TaxID=2940571 RepID=UPI002227C232|nr:4'-phosphopantetheinyl transferase superfamily protein [Flavobacterium sp. 7A]MCW2120701.1 phosphopantetheinyl transferase (holo-ACP synthase) [Flavobacterium sp. 7A]
MIGNDVVDLILAKTESNWKRKGYLDKLFTTLEQNWIHTAPDPDEMVWILWSIKESVYKAYQRIHYQQGFYPIKIKVSSLVLEHGEYQSVIKLFNLSFYGRSFINEKIIHTVAVQDKNDFEKIIILDRISYLKNENRLPIEASSGKPISVSHHGRAKVIVSFRLD